MTAATKWGLGLETAHDHGTCLAPFTVKNAAVVAREDVRRLRVKWKGGGPSSHYEIYLLRSSMKPL